MIWAKTNQSHLEPVVRLQKKIIRIITNQNYLAHTDPLFSCTKILKFKDIHSFLVCQYVHKNFESFPVATHSFRTRSRGRLISEFQRLNVTQQSIKYIGPTEWNRLPENLRQIEKFSVFKSELKKFLIGKYINSDAS